MNLDLVVAGPDTRLTHRLDVGPEACTLLLGVHEGTHQRVEEARGLVPAALVRLTRLRPRRVTDPAPPMAADDDLVAALVAEDAGVRRRALERVGAEVAWRLTGDVPALTAVDGPAGLLLLEDGVLRPTTNTAVYRRLVSYVNDAGSAPSTASAPAPSPAADETSAPDGSVHQ